MLEHHETLYTVGGTVQAGSGIYIPRQADQEMLSHCQHGNFAYVLAARQLGKSSLMVRTAHQLAQQGIGTGVVDLTELGVQASAEEWYLGLMFKIASQLAPNADLLAWWREKMHLGYTQRLVLFFQELLLAESQNKFVIFVDEIDSTLSLEFTDDFFAAIRYTYNARATDPLFQRLSFVLIGVAVPSDLINDPKRTPFNIGERVELRDFTVEESMPLGKGLAQDQDKAYQILKRIWHWTHGHPYLTQRLCKIVSARSHANLSQKEVDQMVTEAFFGDMSRSDSNLQFVNDMLTRRAPDRDAVLKTYSDIRLGWQAVYNEEQSIVKNHLKLSGIVRHEQDVLRVRNRVYKQVFDRRWLRENRSHHWWRDLPLAIKVASFIILLLLIALMITSAAAVQRAVVANERADLAHSRLLISESEALLDSQYDLALLLALEADHLVNTPETSAYLNYALSHNPYLLTYLRAHDGFVRSMAFSENGSFLASASDDTSIILWDLQTNEPVHNPLFAHENSVESLAFSSDGQILASGGCKQYSEANNHCLQGELLIWDMQQEPLVRETLNEHAGNIWSLDFNADNTHLVSSGDTNLTIWDTQTWQPIWQQSQVDTTFVGANFHPQHKNILSVGRGDGTIQIIDVETQAIKTLQAHQDIVYNTTFSPDGRLLAAASRDGTISLWLTDTWEALPLLTAHTDQVVSAQFSPDSRFLVSAGLDGKIIVWDLSQEEKPMQILSGHQGDAHFVIFHPDPEKNLIVSNGPDHSIILWDLTGDSHRQTFLTKQNHPILNLDFSPNGQMIATTGANGTIELWDVPQRQPITDPLTGHTDMVRQIAFDMTGQYLVTGGRDQMLFLWDVTDLPSAPRPLLGHDSVIRSIDFHPEGNIFASSDDDGTIIVWNLQTAQQIGKMQHGTRELFDIAFSPNGDLLASGSWNGTIQFWHTETLHPVGDPIPVGFEHIWAIAFDPTGKKLAVAGGSEKVSFIDVANHKRLPDLLTGHINRINTLAFSPDGLMLVTGGADNQMMFWHTQTQKQLAPAIIVHNDEIYTLTFSPDKRMLASGDLAGNIVLTTIQHDTIDDLVCRIVNRRLNVVEWSQYIGEDYSYQPICQEIP